MIAMCPVFYRLELTFNAEQVCASRRGLGGVWRVAFSARYPGDYERPYTMERFPNLLLWPNRQLVLFALRPYRKGVMVNPKTIALAAVRAEYEWRRAEESVRLFRAMYPWMVEITKPKYLLGHDTLP